MSITKFGKKLLCFLAFFALAFALVSCTTTVPTKTEAELAKEEATAAVEAAMPKIFWDDSAMRDITKSLVLHTKTGDVKIEWASSHPEIIATDGTVTLPGADHEDATLIDPEDESKGKHVAVKLVATFSKEYTYQLNGEEQVGVATGTKEFKFTVLCFTGSKGSIAEVKAAAWQYIYEEMGVDKSISVSNNAVVYEAGATGVVTAKLMADGTGQFMIHDGTEGIYVYYGDSKGEIKVGDVVEVTGNIYSYYGNLQFGSNLAVTVLEDKEIAKPNYKEVTVTEWENSVKDLQKIGYHGGELIAVTAQLKKASEANVAKDWYQLIDPTTGVSAWIYYKSYNAEMQAKLDEFDGKYVRITGVTYDRDSRLVQNHLLWDGGIEEATAPELNDEQKLNLVKSSVQAVAGSYVSGSALALPTEDKEYGATISWNIPEGAPYADGKFAIVSKETTFTAVATVALGELTAEVSVEITVKPIEKVTIANAYKLEKGSVVKISGTVEAVFSSKGYFYLRDASGTILVYVQTSNGITVNGETVTLKAGDQLTLTGSTNVFNGCGQIGTIISYDEYVAGEWKQAEAKQATIAEILAYKLENAPYGEYLYVKGVVVQSGNYYYLAESQAEGAGKISLYNSTVPEEVKALAGTDTEVTLFVYFYGFQKADYSGDTRVVYNGREGEHVIGEYVPEHTHVACPVCGKCTAEGCEGEKCEGHSNVITIAEAVAIASKQAHDTYTEEKYIVVGTISDLYNTKYGNFHLVEGDADLTIYGLYQNGVRYDSMAVKPVEGDVVTVEGILGQYNGTPQIKNAELLAIQNGSGSVTPEHTHVVCPTCGKCTAADCTGEKCPGHVEVPSDAKTYVVSIADYAAANGWASGTMYNTLEMAGVATVTMSAVGGSGDWGANTGKYYTDGNTWRAYQTDQEATIVITAAEGVTIVSVKVTYLAQNTGTLVYGGANVASEQAVTVNGTTITFTIGNTGEKTNGQARVTAIEVVYTGGGDVVVPTHTHVACPTCGLCTSEVCDGTAEEKCAGHVVESQNVTIAQALEIATKAGSSYTTGKYIITGVVESIANETYGNMNIVDAEGNKIYVYGVYIQGSKYGDYSGAKPVVGDTVTLEGVLGTYNSSPQMKNSDLVSFVAAGATSHEHTKCPTCGLCTAEDCNGTAEEKCAGHEAVESKTLSLSFADAANRTSYAASAQVWEQNGVKVTNNKVASTNDVKDYTKPVRFYASSQVIVEAANMKQIEFDCNSSSYATALVNSIGTVAGVTVTVSSDKVVVVFDTAVSSFDIAKLTAQVRVDAITVTVE